MTKPYLRTQYKLIICALICVLFLADHNLAFGQSTSHPKLDSLTNRLKQPFDSDSLHALAYEDVIWHLIEVADDEKIWAYLDSLKSFGKRADYPYAELLYEFNVGYFYFRESKYDSALMHLHLTLDLAKKLDYPKQEVNTSIRIASLLKFQGQRDSAMIYLDGAERLAKSMENNMLIADVLVEKAGLEQDRGNHLVSLQNFLDADSLYDLAQGNRILSRANINTNIAVLHLEQLENDERALYYIKRAKALLTLHGVKHSLAGADLVLARIHLKLGHPLLADSLLTEALAYFRSINHPVQIAKAAMLLGRAKLDRKQREEGEKLLLEAKQRYEELGTPPGLFSVYAHLGHLYKDEKKFDQSVLHFQLALPHAKGETDRATVLRNLALALGSGGSYKEAFDTLRRSILLFDSLNEIQLNQAFQDLEAKYQTTQKEKEIGDLKLVQAQQEVKNQQTLFWSLVGILSLIALALVYFLRSRQKTKINQQLRDLDELKSKLFSDISHEFRTPLSLIKGPVEILTQKLSDQSEVVQELSIVKRNTKKLNHLVDSVQNLAKLDAGKMSLHIRPANLLNHLKIIGASFDSMAASKALAFHMDIDLPDENLYYDPAHLETILYNLLSNAFKFTREGEIKLQAELDAESAVIKVSDTGIGISEVHQEKIFDRYFRAGTPQISVEGVGIGLALASELAKLHHGNLRVQSNQQIGSTFTLRMPITQESYVTRGLEIGSEFLPSESQRLLSPVPTMEETPAVHEDEPVILLVEDNPDMRQHLDAIFKDDYSIILASDGQDGVNKALQYIPDIIISDLMMPVMNGQEFLKSIKSDPKTSHIPFIMLTANHLEEEKLKGLEQRVDDYMTKPFSIPEIKLKVKNLIALREQLRTKYQSSSSTAAIVGEQINETEQQFWAQLNQVVQDNLDNTDFSAEDFSKAMFMSRMQLHRKLKALTNLSTSIFLRTERLKAAKEMLRKPDAFVSNIAYDVGFNSPSFFSKCFKEQFGMSPKEFQNIAL